LAEEDALSRVLVLRTLGRVRRRRAEPVASLDDVVEVLAGIGQIVMGINATIERILAILEGEDDEEADA
jgi:hypothetical protein